MFKSNYISSEPRWHVSLDLLFKFLHHGGCLILLSFLDEWVGDVILEPCD
jgi:hypothetical protein